MSPLRETLADSLTGGQLTEARAQLADMGKKYSDIRAETRKLSHEIENLKNGEGLREDYAGRSWNSRIALDSKWEILSGYAQHRVIQKSDVDLYHDLMSYSYQYCPLIKAAVDIKTRYTFGMAYSIEGKTDAAKEAIAAITEDLRNCHAIFGAQATLENDRELQKGGNAYFAIWIDEDPVQIRVWTSYEIGDVIFDPEDGDTPLYYIRTFTKNGEQVTRAYPSIYNNSPTQNMPRNIANTYTVDDSIVVYQMCEGRQAKQKWALSPYTAALPWNRAYEQFLLDFAAIVQIIRKYSTLFTTKESASQVAAIQTQFANEQRGPGETSVGNGIVATEGNDFKVIDAGSGKIVGPADSRYFLLQVCACTFVPENMLTGNLQTGNRASAQEMTANFLPVIEERQTMWTETFTEIFAFILQNNDFEVSFPPIRTEDAQTYLQTLIQAITLGSPGKWAGVMKPIDVIKAIYEGLDIPKPGEEDLNKLVAELEILIKTDPGANAALDSLTQATNLMNQAIKDSGKQAVKT